VRNTSSSNSKSTPRAPQSSGTNASDLRVNLSVLTNERGRLSKTARLNGDGIVFDPAPGLHDGQIKTGAVDFTQLPDLITGLSPRKCLTFGIPKNGVQSQRLYSRRSQPPGEGITRTEEDLTYPDGPALLFADFDGLPAAVSEIDELETFIRQLIGRDVPMVVVPSSSSNIYNGDTRVRGLHGVHAYIAVERGTDIPEIAQRLRTRAVLRGLGRAVVFNNGHIEIRPPWDHSVFQASRQVFAAGAVCEPPLEQRREPRLFNAATPALSLSDIPELTPEDRKRIEKIEAGLLAQKEPEAEEKRRAYRSLRLAEGVSETALDALDGGVLAPDCPIFLADGRIVEVRDIVADPAAFHEVRCKDPAEPDYDGGRNVAIIYTKNIDARLRIHSKAHGGRDFRIDDFRPLQNNALASAPSALRLEALKEFNETYAVVQRGPNVLIMQEHEDGSVEFLRPADLRLLLQHRKVPSAVQLNKTEPLAKAWLEWEGRRQYNNVVFRPGIPEVPEGTFNMWSGWGVELNPSGKCDLFYEFMRRIICGDNEDHFRWLLTFFAHMVQRPTEKPETAVALRGGQGAGKTFFGKVFKRLLGSAHVTVNRFEQITKNFNKHLEGCLLLQCEEAVWGGHHSSAGVLKDLVTGDTLMIEQKYVDPVERPNFLRMLITSNEDWIWPADIDDRRLAAFDVSDERANDRAYFGAIAEELENGGYGRLLHDLLSYSIDDELLHSPPRTTALEAQAAESMPVEERWLLDLLQTGEIQGMPVGDGSIDVPIGILYDGYTQTANARERGYLKSREAFSHFISKRLSAVKTGGRQRVPSLIGRPQSYVYRIPPLADLRAAYTRRGRVANETWDQPNKWRLLDLFTELPLGPSGEGSTP
jgi:hypothetical protein